MMLELAAPCDILSLPEPRARKPSRKVSISLEEYPSSPKVSSFTPQKGKTPEQSKVLRIKSAGYSIGKQADNCEDAFFVSDRGFGVADGVSGWNDYGFSSHAFSSQLMDHCQQEIEKFDLEAEKMDTEKK